MPVSKPDPTLDPGGAWVRDVLAFWFDEIPKEAWFKRTEGLDETIRQRFLDLHEACASRSPDCFLSGAETALAAILVLDQFPRNMFRGTARAFATDAMALAVAEGAVTRGLDRSLDGNRRVFCYLPFEHSENTADQDRAVALIGAIGDDGWTKYAVLHRDIVAQFGRFPHRNVVLGRASTDAEIAFLAKGDSSFGQGTG